MATLNMIFNNVQIQPSLKTYEEIVAMSVDNALAELNTYPTDYYNKFNSEGHINYYGILSDDGDANHFWGEVETYYVSYDRYNSLIWVKSSGGSSGPS